MKNNFRSIFLALLIAGFMAQVFQYGSKAFAKEDPQERLKQYTEEAKKYEEKLKKDPEDQKAWYNLGIIRGMELKDYVGMNQAFKEAAKISDKYAVEIEAYRNQFWVDHINAGVILAQRASRDSLLFYDQAIKEYKTAVTIWPDTSLTYRYLALTYLKKSSEDSDDISIQNDLDNALSNQKKSWDLGQDKDQYKQIGAEVLRHGLKIKDQFKTENADKLKLQKNFKEMDKGSFKTDVTNAFGPPDSKKRIKKNAKKEEWIYNNYGMTLTFDGERVVSKKIVKPYDLNIDSTKYYNAIDQFNKAVDVFESIKAVDSKDNENLNMLLQAYYEADRTVEATKTFKLAVENEPGNKMNHYILGLLYRTVGDYDGAIAEFNEAIQIDPEFTDAIYDIGASYYNWGVKMKKAAQEKGNESVEYKTKFQEALPWMEKVSDIKIKNAKELSAKSGKDWHAEVSAEDAKIWDSVGTIYALLGQTQKATKALDEADKIRKSGK